MPPTPVPPLDEILANAEIELIVPNMGGLTKQVHSAQYKGANYILRKCNGNADKIAAFANHLSAYQVTPRLLTRDESHLLFEFLEGRDLKYEDNSPETAYHIGRTICLVNRIPKQWEADPDEKFQRALKYVLEQRIIDEEKEKAVRQSYEELKPETIETRTELSDSIPGNFRLSNGKIYLVDLELGTMLKGSSFAKAFLKWFKEPEQRKRFLEGYETENDSSFLTPKYQQFIYLTHILNKLNDFHKRGVSIEKMLKHLELHLRGELV